MTMNPEMDQTKKQIWNPEGEDIIQRRKSQLEMQRQDIRDFFKTNRTESKPLDPIELNALDLTVDNFELAKEVYAQMAMEELDKIASDDELARIKLQNKLDVNQGIRSYDAGWWNMQLLSPESIAKIAKQDADKTREAQKKQAEKEQRYALQEARSKIKKRPTITADQAQEFQEWQKVQQASMEGGGFAGTAEAEAPEELKEEIGKAEGKVRRGKGFKTATGEFEPKAEAFAVGLSPEMLNAQGFVQELSKEFSKSELKLFKPHADRYLRNVTPRRKEWEDKIKEVKKAENLDRANELQASSKREAELNRTVLEELAKAIKNNPQILEQ